MAKKYQKTDKIEVVNVKKVRASVIIVSGQKCN